MVMVSGSAVAEAAIAPAMISPWTSRLWMRASISPARNCERDRTPINSASRPVTLRKMMRRVRLEKLMRTKRCQPRFNRAASRLPFARGARPSNRFGSTSSFKLSGVRLSTVDLPVARPRARLRWRRSQEGPTPRARPGAPASYLLEAIADAVERFDHVEIVVGALELLAQALDVAVDGAVVDIDLIVVGRVHQGVAALDHAGTARERLQDQELGYG